jgi:cysteine desulfurase/selenocysteine lyase
MAILSVQREFALRPGVVYLNHAGVSPWPVRAGAAIKQFTRQNVAQGALAYPAWIAVETALREQLRVLLNAPSADDIALLKNTSEALSVVAYGLHWRRGDNVVSTDQEFPSNRIPWESLRSFGVELRAVDVRGPSPEDALLAAVDGRTRLLTVSSVQYATGLRLDLARLGEVCGERGVLFCVDAIQSLGALRMDVQKIRADFVMADGHKWMLGPEGVAVFFSRPEARERLRLRQFGWHMVEVPGDYERGDWEAARSARRFECGSPNMLGIHGLHASLSLLLEVGMDQVERQVLEHAERLLCDVRSSPELQLITPDGPGCHGGIVTFRAPGCATPHLFAELQARGVICAQRAGGVRFSPHFYTSPEQVREALALAVELARTRPG